MADSLAKWLHGRGMELNAPAIPGSRRAVLQHMAARYPNEHYILCGRSGRDFGHAVVCEGRKIVHDPLRGERPGSAMKGPIPTTGRYSVIMIRPRRAPLAPATKHARACFRTTT